MHVEVVGRVESHAPEIVPDEGGHQVSSVAISGNQLNPTLRRSYLMREAITGHPRPSYFEAIRARLRRLYLSRMFSC
jgi:hypothetical protein